MPPNRQIPNSPNHQIPAMSDLRARIQKRHGPDSCWRPRPKISCNFSIAAARPSTARASRSWSRGGLGRAERPLFQDARFRHRRAARAHHRQDRDRRGAGRAAAARPPAVHLRGHERDEQLQHLARHAGAGGLSQRVARRRAAPRRSRRSPSPTIRRHFSRDFARAHRAGGHRTRLRRLPLPEPALDAGAFLRRAPAAGARRHRHHRQPQSAARQRLQGLLRRRRASGGAARRAASSGR